MVSTGPEKERLSFTGGYASAQSVNYVLFQINRRSFAFPLEQVERSVRIAALTNVPESPGWLLGLIDYAGAILPVIDLRPRFGIERTPIQLSDRLLLVRSGNRMAALLADQVNGVLTLPKEELLPIPGGKQASRLLQGILRSHETVILILDAISLLEAVDIPEAAAEILCDKTSPLPNASFDPADLTQVEGIDSTCADRLKATGIHTVAELARCKPADLATRLGFNHKRLPEIRSWVARAAEIAHRLCL